MLLPQTQDADCFYCLGHLHSPVQELVNSFVPRNIVQALAENSLLAVLVVSAIVGYLVKPKGLIVRLAQEVELIVTVISELSLLTSSQACPILMSAYDVAVQLPSSSSLLRLVSYVAGCSLRPSGKQIELIRHLYASRRQFFLILSQ